MTKMMRPDPRRHAYRADLADVKLRGLIEAERYVPGEARQVTAPSLPLRREPRFDSILDTEALHGETVTVFAESEGWAWVQIDRDGYVGYMPSKGLSASIVAPTHRIAALRSYVYPEPDGKLPPLALLSLNALITAKGLEGRFLTLEGGGYVVARHALSAGEVVDDPVAVAEAFVGTPYLWAAAPASGSTAQASFSSPSRRRDTRRRAMPTCRRQSSASLSSGGRAQSFAVAISCSGRVTSAS